MRAASTWAFRRGVWQSLWVRSMFTRDLPLPSTCCKSHVKGVSKDPVEPWKGQDSDPVLISTEALSREEISRVSPGLRPVPLYASSFQDALALQKYSVTLVITNVVVVLEVSLEENMDVFSSLVTRAFPFSSRVSLPERRKKGWGDVRTRVCHRLCIKENAEDRIRIFSTPMRGCGSGDDSRLKVKPVVKEKRRVTSLPSRAHAEREVTWSAVSPSVWIPWREQATREDSWVSARAYLSLYLWWTSPGMAKSRAEPCGSKSGVGGKEL